MLGSSDTQVLSGEPRPQAEHAVANPRLHRTEWHVLPGCDLAVRQAFEICDLERAALLLRQAVEPGAETRGTLVSIYGVLEALGWDHLAAVRRDARFGALARAARPLLVERDVADHAQE